MECVIRRRRKGVIKPIKVNRGIMMLENDDNIRDEEPLSPTSLVFHKPNFNIHILAIMGCNTPVDVELCKAKASISLLKHPRFSSIVVGDPSKGDLKWVRTKVDLDKHFVVPNIDLQDTPSPTKFVENYMYNLSKTSLDKSRPLWDIHILHLPLSENVKSLGIFRVHHSLGDGASLMSLLLALTRQTSNPKALPTIPSQRICDGASSNKAQKGFLWRWILGLWWMLRLTWNTLLDVFLFVVTMIYLKDNSPLKRSSMGSQEPRRIVYKIISLDDMKLVKNAIGGTINDVALGITQAGLSRYLSRLYESDGGWNKHSTGRLNKMLKQIRLRSVLLINLRPSGGIQALADMMEKDTEVKWGNSVGFVLLPFTIGLRDDDPLDYIREAKATVDRKKHSLEALYTSFISGIFLKLFGTKVATILSDRVNSHTTIAFSNLVGPLEEIGFYGHPLAFLAPSSYGQPHPVMINFQSYVNKMTIVLAVDEHTVPDPHQLCDDIAVSLQLVKDAAISQGLVKDFVGGS